MLASQFRARTVRLARRNAGKKQQEEENTMPNMDNWDIVRPGTSWKVEVSRSWSDDFEDLYETEKELELLFDDQGFRPGLRYRNS